MVGRTLNHYEVLESLGAGGMGEVYRARDTRLDRDVAIKVLPPDFAADPDRRARFEREAKLLASLNHTGIAGIYGLEDADGVQFIAMEAVEGSTLAAAISASGPMAIEAALDLARQLAEALEAAHEAGIVHRDLKTANIMVTAGGRVKVLDFGLAKGLCPGKGSPTAAPGSSQSPTMVGATQVGAILGTAAYMSPEQARGEAVDRRTDIWAFGVVLFEMLTGRLPFVGGSRTDVLAAVVKDEPDEALLPAATPGHVRHLLRRCLTKDPCLRLQHIGDARVELADPLPVDPATGGPRAAGFGSRTLTFVGVAAALCGAIVAWVLRAPSEPPGAATARFSFEMPADLRIVADDPDQDGPWLPYPPFALSSDGTKLVFVAAGDDGERQLYVRSQDRLGVRALPGTENADLPFFAPDGSRVGFWAAGTLLQVSIDGGPPVRIADLPTRPRGAAWALDDSIILGGNNRGLSRVSAAGTEAVVEITTTDVDLGHHYHAWPSVLPDGAGWLDRR